MKGESTPLPYLQIVLLTIVYFTIKYHVELNNLRLRIKIQNRQLKLVSFHLQILATQRADHQMRRSTTIGLGPEPEPGGPFG